MIRPTLLAVLGLAAAITLPAPTHAQAAAELVQTIRAGGGWVAIPISRGRADLSSDTVPTLGLTLTGCFTVWGGHSGEWSFAARDGISGERLDAVASPGEGVPFSVDTGMQSHLDLQVRWSEPRDTVLQLWVGLEVPQRPDACTPTYGDGR
jgi:hypothetical protein